MPDKYYEPDEPTLPANYPARNQQPQGKLVVGGFQDQSRSAQRQPYQYPSQPRQSQPGYPQAPAGPEVPRPYPNQAYAPQRQAAYAPGNYPPYQPSGRPRRRRRGGCTVGCLVALLLVFLLGYFTITTGQRVLAFGSAISNQAPLSTQTAYMSGSSRTNLLIMGYGGGSHSGAYLTDSMSVVSIMPQSHHTSIISVPRDLWVQVPANSGNYAKLNTVYTVASNNGQNPVAGGNAAAQKISAITGLDVKYWVTINFTGFRDLINAIGGIDVYVPDSFNACYPVNDDASINASWKKVQFNKGMQHMDGETAIEYARAREPLAVCGMGTSENLAELTDFARSARQQIIIKAVLSKVKQPGTWPHLFDAMTALQHTIYTNMSLADLALFGTKMDLNDPHTAHIGLSNQNVLVDSVSDDGQDILLPENNNWSAIGAYINQHLYQ